MWADGDREVTMRGSIVRRGEKFHAVLDLPRGEDGKRKQKWLSGYPTRREAEAALAHALNEVHSGRYVEPTAMTVRQLPGAFIDVVVAEVARAEAERDREINRLLGGDVFTVPLPLVANAVLARATTRRECLTVALELRKSSAATKFRRLCANVDHAIKEGDRRRVERAINDLARAGVRLSEAVSPGEVKHELSPKELFTFTSPVLRLLLAYADIPIAHALRGGDGGSLRSSTPSSMRRGKTSPRHACESCGRHCPQTRTGREAETSTRGNASWNGMHPGGLSSSVDGECSTSPYTF
jgi:hypothetical protein